MRQMVSILSLSGVYATALIELDGGQKLVRFYDPSGNLIEIRTPWDKLGRESD